jgi:hypothetical protein
MWLELILSSAIGAIAGILINMSVEYLRRPHLALSRKAERDRPQQPGRPASVVRPVRLAVTNKRGPRWMTRDPALRCEARITFRHLDGQDIFGRSAGPSSSRPGRLSTEPMPRAP